MAQHESESMKNILLVLLQSSIGEWITSLSLIFGGCCSNALALEVVAKLNPHAGSLVTLAQFILVSAYGLPRQLTLKPDTSLYPGLVLNRDKLLQRIAAEIVSCHTEQHPNNPYFVSIAGAHSISHVFAAELVKDLEQFTPGANILHTTLTSDFRRFVRGSEDPNVRNSVIIYSCEGPTPPPSFAAKWDYEIIVLDSKTHPMSNAHPLNSELVIDFSPSSPSGIISINPRLKWRFPRFLGVLSRIRLKKRTVPISRWLIQVVLFFITSLLNNAAFGYNVPMSVHIIFRSGGLVVNMLMGWLIDGRRYSAYQVSSVILVTLGVMCTTWSASPPSQPATSSSKPSGSYVFGILILTLALIMSGFMGLAQDKTYARYGRGNWQESMFYLHILALPGFGFVWQDILGQLRTVNSSVKTEMDLGTLLVPLQLSHGETKGRLPGFVHSLLGSALDRRISIPSFYFPLVLNIVTQLVCVSGVNRLTSRVNSLTVTLVLVIRKAVSLGISVLWLGKGNGGALLWTGAALVLVGTITYTISPSTKTPRQKSEGGDKASKAAFSKKEL